MLAKSHVLSNTATIATLGVVDLITLNTAPSFVVEKTQQFNQWLVGTDGWLGTLFIVLSALLFYLGTLLPDIDYEKSWICQHLGLYVNVEHRTITHALWFPILYLLIGFVFRPFVWLAIGYVLHLFYDSMTPTGVVWFYMHKSDFIRYESGVKIKRGHFWHLYKTGQTSEKVVVGCIWLIFFISLMIFLFLFIK